MIYTDDNLMMKGLDFSIDGLSASNEGIYGKWKLALSSNQTLNGTTVVPPGDIFTVRTISTVVYSVLTAIIIIGGIVGNSLSIHKLVKTGILRFPTSQFFVWLCLCDILVLLLYVVPEFFTRGIYTLTKLWIFKWNSISGLCQTFILFSYWMRLLSVWTLAAFSIQRYRNLSTPQVRRSRLEIRYLVIIFSVSLLISLVKAYLTRSIPGNSLGSYVCSPPSYLYLVNFGFDIFYAVITVILPSLIIILTNLLIATNIYSLKLRYANSSTPVTPNSSYLNTPRSSVSHQLDHTTTLPATANPHHHPLQHSKSHQSHHHAIAIQFSILLLITSFSFVVLCWPFMIIWIFNLCLHIQNKPFNLEQNSFGYYANLVARLMFYTHFATNLLHYTLVTNYFKMRLKRVFTFKLLRKQANDCYRN